jgi:hypothetical protein
MDIVSPILSFLLFVAFIPGVLVTLPSKTSSRRTVLLVHALLFTVTTAFVMRYYWINIKGYIEKFGNYGAVCPNGFVPHGDDCVPVGQATYNTDAGVVPEPSPSSP